MLFIIIFSALFFTTTVQAQSTLTLAQALEQARHSSPEVAMAHDEVDAAKAQVVQGRARPNPELAYFQEDTRDATKTTSWQLNQQLELGGKRRARIEAAEVAQARAGSVLSMRQAELEADVTLAFFEGVSAQEKIRLANEMLALTQKSQQAASKRVQAGKISPLELTKAKIAVANAQLELAQAQSELLLANQRLAMLCGDEPTPTPPLLQLDTALDQLPTLPSADTLNARLLNAPAIQQAQLEINRRSALVDLERAKRLPDITISLGIKQDAQLDHDQALLGVSMPIPLFDRNRGNLRTAMVQQNQADLASSRLRQQLINTVMSAQQRLQVMHLQAGTLKREVLPGAQAAYDAANLGFSAGKFNFLDVLDAQRTLFQAKSHYLTVVLDAHRAAAEIERLLGGASKDNSPPLEGYAAGGGWSR